MTVQDVEDVQARFRALADDFKAELAPLEQRGHLTHTERSRMTHLRETLHQTENGLSRGEGTDPRLDALVRDPAVVALRLARPGIASLTRLRDQLLKEEQEKTQKDPGAWPRRFRLRAEVPLHNLRGKNEGVLVTPTFSLGARDLLPGEEIELSESQARAFGDKFELV